MSDVTVVCPSCSALLKPAGPAPAGKKFRCPKCQGVVEVPASAGNKPAAPVTPAAPPAKAPAVPPSALARAEIQPAVAPAPRPKMTPVPPPPRRSKLPLVLGVLLLFLFIACGGVATGGYFAWGWYKQWDASRTRAANNQPAPPTTSRQEAETFPTPDAALDAYVKALPDAERDAEWADGKFQRFPAEFDGDDQAHIVCVVRGGPDAADTYRKYAFAKRDGGWRHTDRTTGDYKDLDPKRYAVAWNKPPDPPRGFDLAGETKKALAGVTLKPLDVKLGHLQMTLQAPAGATVEDNGFEVAVTHGERFRLRLDFGRVDGKHADSVWRLNGNLPVPEVLVDKPTVHVSRFKAADGANGDSVRFVTGAVFNDFDVHFTHGIEDKAVPLADCLVMLHCARTAALKPGQQRLGSAADLEKVGWHLDKDETSGKIVSLGFGRTPCTDTSLALLPKLTPDLEFLFLGGQRVTDDGLKALAALPNLKVVGYPSLMGGLCREGADLAPIAKLAKLEELHLASTRVEDKDLVHLKDLKGLRRLSLGGTKVNGEGLQHLGALKGLELLDLGGCPVTDANLRHVQPLTGLTYLPLYGTQITDEGLRWLRPLRKLQNLELGATAVNGSGFVNLAGLTDVGYISLGGTKVTDEHLRHFAGMKKLGGLDLSGTPVQGHGLSALKDLPQLNSLALARSQVNDEGLKHIGQLKQLQSLTLTETKVTDAGLPHLQALTKLMTLELGNTNLNGAGLEHLRTLAALESLHLGQTKVTDASLKHLAPLKALQELDLSETPVGDAGLANLNDNAALEILGLFGTKVTDAGVVHLKGLKKLQSVSAGKTGMTKKGAAELKKALPDVQVDVDE